MFDRFHSKVLLLLIIHKSNKMKIPNTISLNTIRAYEFPKNSELPATRLKSWDFEWDANIPKTLVELCLTTIANIFRERPLINYITTPADKATLLDLLPADLPLKISVNNIHDDVFWKRCFLHKWPNTYPLPIEGTRLKRCGKWKMHYLRKFLEEYLENLKPEQYQPAEVTEFCNICSPYVTTLHLKQLQKQTNSSRRIPLNLVLSHLQNLEEISICFKQRYVGEINFTWDVVRISKYDVHNLANGLEKCRLNILRIINSDIDATKSEILLNPIKNYDNLLVLDFTCCRIGDQGVKYVLETILDKGLLELNLSNNRIGADGSRAIGAYLSDNSCSLKKLNLRLNNLLGKSGGDFILQPLASTNKSLQELNFSSCGLCEKNVIVESVIKYNKTLQMLDISNNRLGNAIGKLIVANIPFNKSLKELNLRSCEMNMELESEISQIFYDRRSRLF